MLWSSAQVSSHCALRRSPSFIPKYCIIRADYQMSVDELPEFSDTEKLGSKGIRLVNNTVEDELGWVFREQATHDLGIDAHIEVVSDKNRATGQIIAAQIKCGTSFFKESSTTGYVFRPKPKHVNYWTGHSLPVIVIICHPVSGECWWIEVTSKNIKSTGKGRRIIVPFGQRFDETHKHVLAQIAGRTLAERIRERYKRRLAVAPIIDDRQFIEIIHRGGILMGFRRIAGNDFRALAFSEDYVLYQSDSAYGLGMWKDILELSGVEDWEIEEALEKVDQEVA